MKLYGFWRSLATYRVKGALALKGIKVDEEVSIDLLKGQQLNPDYRAVNPQAVVPSLVLDDGGPPLFQSLAILEYLEETKPQPPLLSQNPPRPAPRACLPAAGVPGLRGGPHPPPAAPAESPARALPGARPRADCGGRRPSAG